jgi:hypothetical protein
LKSIDSLAGRIVVGLLIVGIVGAGIGAAIGAFFQALPWEVAAAIFLLLFLYGLVGASYEVKREKDGLEQKLATTKKRKAVMDLLGDAQEEGESLKQGRKYPFNAEISDEYQARYDKEVRMWVNRTYNLINDAFGKAWAQRFISNEGYTEIELLGHEPPPYVYLSSTQKRYLIPARLKRLHELIPQLHGLDVNPDFDPRNRALGLRQQRTEVIR